MIRIAQLLLSYYTLRSMCVSRAVGCMLIIMRCARYAVVAVVKSFFTRLGRTYWTGSKFRKQLQFRVQNLFCVPLNYYVLLEAVNNQMSILDS